MTLITPPNQQTLKQFQAKRAEIAKPMPTRDSLQLQQGMATPFSSAGEPTSSCSTSCYTAQVLMYGCSWDRHTMAILFTPTTTVPGSMMYVLKPCCNPGDQVFVAFRLTKMQGSANSCLGLYLQTISGMFTLPPPLLSQVLVAPGCMLGQLRTSHSSIIIVHRSRQHLQTATTSVLLRTQ